jgi:hypothetical protein
MMVEVLWDPKEDDHVPLSSLVPPIKIICECREDWGLLNTLPSFSMQRLKQDKVRKTNVLYNLNSSTNFLFLKGQSAAILD